MVATAHFMPTLFIPTTFIGYTPTGVVNSPLSFTTSTGATLSFPNLYADIKGIPWLFGGTAWAGTRYYKRESVYISDFFYWNPSGVGAGIEDINLGKDLRLSYAAFAVDGRLAPPPQDVRAAAGDAVDFGVRNDLQLRGIKFWDERRVPARVPVHRELQQQPRPRTAGGASPSSSCRRCSAATTSSPSSMAGVRERALARSRASTTPTSRSTTHPMSRGSGSSTCSPFSPATLAWRPGWPWCYQRDDLGNAGTRYRIGTPRARA